MSIAPTQSRYPLSITYQTAPSVVLGAIRAVIARHPSARHIGLVCYSRHLQFLDDLEPQLHSRIAWAYPVGKSRPAEDCDLSVFICTPAVPPIDIAPCIIVSLMGCDFERGKRLEQLTGLQFACLRALHELGGEVAKGDDLAGHEWLDDKSSGTVKRLMKQLKDHGLVKYAGRWTLTDNGLEMMR